MVSAEAVALKGIALQCDAEKSFACESKRSFCLVDSPTN